MGNHYRPYLITTTTGETILGHLNAQISGSPRWGAYSAHTDPLAGFRGRPPGKGWKRGYRWKGKVEGGGGGRGKREKEGGEGGLLHGFKWG